MATENDDHKTNISQHILAISTLNAQEIETDFKFLLKILHKIVDDPNNIQYRDINFDRITQKLHPAFIDLLVECGFHQTSNDKHLTMDLDRLHTLKQVKHSLLRYIAYSSCMMIFIVCSLYYLIVFVVYWNENSDKINQSLSKPPTIENEKHESFTLRNWETLIQLRNKYPIIGSGCTANDVTSCVIAERLTMVMKQYDGSCASERRSNPICDVLDDYLHVLHHHESDKEFEFTFNQLPFCDIKRCKMLRRNYSNENKMNEPTRRRYCDIMDKVHCYLYHSYDLRHRLREREKTAISNNMWDDDDEKTNRCSYVDTYLRSVKIATLRTKLSANHGVNGVIVKRTKQRYHCIYFNPTHHDDDQQKKQKMYSFGYCFKYGFYDEPNHAASQFFFHNYALNTIHIKPKYDNLKIELTSNPICVLTMEQYNTQYEQALVNRNSRYCRKNFVPCIHHNKGYVIQLKQIISLMTYCNCDRLQFEFSKTYRIDNGTQHINFCHLGKNLTIAVWRFGRDYLSSKVYHEVQDAMFFPQYFGKDEISGGCPINGPLSTSSSLEVALSFSDGNNGLVVQFGASPGGLPQHLSLAWLSNYPSEKEYFFIRTIYGLQIDNVICTKNDYEYEAILNVMKRIEHITGSNIKAIAIYSEDINENFMNIAKAQIEVNEVQIEVSDKILHTILANQLSHTLSEYESFNSDDPHLIYMCNAYFQSRKLLRIDYTQCTKHVLMSQMLLCFKMEWINIKLCNALFPNIENVQLINMNLCEFVFRDLMQYLTTLREKNAALKTISIEPKENSQLTTKQFVDAFSESLQTINVFLNADIKENKVWLHTNHPFVTSALFLALHADENRYFKDKSGEIIKIIHVLTVCGTNEIQLYKTNESNQYEVDISETLWNECVNKSTFSVNWDHIIANKDSYIFHKFYNTEYQWIKMNVVNSVFPRLDRIVVRYLYLCSSVLEDITQCLITTKASLKEIIIHLELYSEISASEAIVRCQELFNSIGFQIQTFDEESDLEEISWLGRETEHLRIWRLE